MKEYVTVLGDTWDGIAKKLYGEEHRAAELMDLNRERLTYMVFPDAVSIRYEEDSVQEQTPEASYPDWRT